VPHDAPVPLTTPTLTTSRLHLRPVTEGDADDLVAMHTDREVMAYWDSPAWADPARAQRFVANSRAMAEEGEGARVVVRRRADDAFLGWCSVSRWHSTFRSAAIGYCYGRAAWGHGYATEAAGALLGWAFETLDLNRVQAETDTRNLGSARVLEKLGFTREGTLREDCVVDGVVSDSWVFGLLRREWEPIDR
jgi:RimJ/RimL family protein N-acetyltransferase